MVRTARLVSRAGMAVIGTAAMIGILRRRLQFPVVQYTAVQYAKARVPVLMISVHGIFATVTMLLVLLAAIASSGR